jgi:YfiH family protein
VTLPDYIRSPALDGLPGIRHGFFTRQGGVSEGIFAGLNCGFGSNDDRVAVAENRTRVAQAMGRDEADLVTVYQIHSAICAPVETPWTPEAAPEADAMATDRPGIVLGVLAADCAPVLLADPEARVIGSAHAGWKGALGGVVEAALEKMVERGAKVERIRAAIGPCIAQASYEVGPEFVASFTAVDPANKAFFISSTRQGHSMFDLPGYLSARLGRIGLAAVTVAGLDTAADPERFFSYRRACLAGLKQYGRLISTITLA